MTLTTNTFGPYSPVRRAGDLYFVSGQIGVDMETKVAPSSVSEQAAKALDNMGEVLASVGLGYKDVVKTTIFVTDIGDFAAVNDVYVQYFAQPRPARSTVAAKELPRVATNCPILVEIEAIAIKQETN